MRAAPTGSSRSSSPRSSSRSGRTRAGCASRSSSGSARTGTRATSRARGRHGRGRRSRHRGAGRPWEALRRHAHARPASGEEIVELLGVRLTHPDRVDYPELGFTKLDLALYYVTLADAVLPYSRAGPSRSCAARTVHGETFYQKKPATGRRPSQALRGTQAGRGAPVRGLGARPRRARPGRHPRGPSLERARAHLEQPDQVIFDLDPDEALPFSRVATAARRVRALLTELGLESFVKTPEARACTCASRSSPSPGGRARGVHTRRGAAARPPRAETFTANMAKAQRKGRVFVDYLRNVRGAMPSARSPRVLAPARRSRSRRLERARSALRPPRLHCRGSASSRARAGRAGPAIPGRGTGSGSSGSRRRSPAAWPGSEGRRIPDPVAGSDVPRVRPGG